MTYNYTRKQDGRSQRVRVIIYTEEPDVSDTEIEKIWDEYLQDDGGWKAEFVDSESAITGQELNAEVDSDEGHKIGVWYLTYEQNDKINKGHSREVRR